MLWWWWWSILQDLIFSTLVLFCFFFYRRKFWFCSIIIHLYILNFERFQKFQSKSVLFFFQHQLNFFSFFFENFDKYSTKSFCGECLSLSKLKERCACTSFFFFIFLFSCWLWENSMSKSYEPICLCFLSLFLSTVKYQWYRQLSLLSNATNISQKLKNYMEKNEASSCDYKYSCEMKSERKKETQWIW